MAFFNSPLASRSRVRFRPSSAPTSSISASVSKPPPTRLAKPSLKLLVQISTTVTSGGAATLQVKLQGAVDTGSGAPAAFSDWWLSPVYALATLVQGARLYDMDMPRPPDGIAIPRYLQMGYVVAGATTTAGNVSSYIVLDRHDLPYTGIANSTLGGYPAGIAVAN